MPNSRNISITFNQQQPNQGPLQTYISFDIMPNESVQWAQPGVCAPLMSVYNQGGDVGMQYTYSILATGGTGATRFTDDQCHDINPLAPGQYTTADVQILSVPSHTPICEAKNRHKNDTTGG